MTRLTVKQTGSCQTQPLVWSRRGCRESTSQSRLYCTLGAQVYVRSSILGSGGRAKEAQSEFLMLMEDAIRQPDLLHRSELRDSMLKLGGVEAGNTASSSKRYLLTSLYTTDALYWIMILDIGQKKYAETVRAGHKGDEETQEERAQKHNKFNVVTSTNNRCRAFIWITTLWRGLKKTIWWKDSV